MPTTQQTLVRFSATDTPAERVLKLAAAMSRIDQRLNLLEGAGEKTRQPLVRRMLDGNIMLDGMGNKTGMLLRTITGKLEVASATHVDTQNNYFPAGWV